ncbi:Hypothetical leucine rich repeat protein [Ectocarpus siliculosus]|uniref:Hypothetical leucine rich repeat protein n=1 Tax=Ectocarpus siliculosus TaxID=2880 RepID=D8LHG7_ECTSI|nr:Hypothetical leucine rich repeat protein [Ectocarpus siliculosus]|eukprot:CBN79118.1 Hypothetical leucine rich repeat protein [Ectocarpus siliculosus]
MSIGSSETAKSASRGFKKVKKSAMLTLRIGEYVVKTQVVAPVVTKVVQEWKGFNRFRDRHQAERRNKTLDWFEDRVATMRREEENMRQRKQEQRRTKRRAQLKQERSRTQREDFLNETRAEFKHQADLRLTTSLEKERVRDYFLDNNDGWQMQALTRHVQEDEDRERQRKRDAEAEKVRQGDANRQAAADEYLAEYDRGEVITQATLRIMRRSGIVAGVNAPPAEIKEEPLETDTYLLLRLKPPAPPPTPAAEEKVEMKKEVNNNNSGRRLPPPLGIGGIRQSSGTGGSKPPAFPAAGERNGHHQRAGRQTAVTEMPGKNSSRSVQPVQSVEATPNNGAGPTAGPVAAEGRKPSRGGGIRGGGGRAGNHNRGKKRSSQAFEVDLLRFRGVEEMRGWKLGAPGGESLASDLASGACPRLSVLRLGWCLLGDRGACAIVRALCGGGGASAAGRTLRTLDLRGNAVTAVGLRVLAGPLAFGGLPALRALDLGSNSLRDEGGKAVAHRLLAGAGTWRRLTRLDLSGNGMGNGGVEAVFKAVTAPGVTLAPDVEFISLLLD